MKWIDSYELNIPLLDKQHKELFQMLHVINESFKKGTTHQEVIKVLKFLTGYVKHHFSAEEEVMRIIEFNELDDHKYQHGKLLSELKHKLEHIKVDRHINLYEVQDFLIDWICNHIISEDMKIRDFIEKRKKDNSFVKTMTKETSHNIISDILQECNRIDSLCRQGVLTLEEKQERIEYEIDEFLTMFQYTSLSELYDKKKVVDTLIDKKYLDKGIADRFWKNSVSIEFLKRILNESNDQDYDVLMLDALQEEGLISESTREKL